ncbi:MAG: protein kinase domain-containing protein [Phycisphaerales bacterium]
MNDQRTPAEMLFLEARTLDPAERAAFLDSRCGGDESLRAGVESILAADSDAGSFLATPVLSPDSAAVREVAARLREEPAPRLAAGARVGRYRIVGILGEGAMGTVYEAEQDDPNRHVALKVLRDGLATRPNIQRFRDESRLLARLSHPCIARVYEAGLLASGAGEQTPYFAMELVPGARSLTRYCDEERLTLSARLDLLARVCEGVQQAHRQLVVHRDLKPANILVGRDGTPRIIDFGVARWPESERTAATNAGHLIGTLQYMSPEQCGGGDVDAAADVFALGAILYELACGKPWQSFESLSTAEAVRRIAEAQVPRPTSVAPGVPRDVETIILHAMERLPGRRYQSAGALGEDLRRFLRSEPIAARRSSAAHRLRLFVRRRPGLTASLATVAASIVVVAALGAAWSNDRAAGRALQRTLATLAAGQAVRPSDSGDDSSQGHVGGERLFMVSLKQSERAEHGIAVIKSIPSATSRSTPIMALSDDHSVVASDALTNVPVPDWLTDSPQREQPFVMEQGFLADVIVKSPGRELVVTLRPSEDVLPLSRIGLLRVYDARLIVLREMWTWGRFRHAFWDADARQLVLTVECPLMSEWSPDLAAWDRRWCKDVRATTTMIAAIAPADVRGVLVPARTNVEPELAAARWCLVRPPIELARSDSPWIVRYLEAVGRSAGGGYEVVAQIDALLPIAAASPTVESRARIDSSGRVLATFEVSELHRPALGALMEQPLKSVNIAALVQARQVAEPLLFELGDAESVVRALADRADLDGTARTYAEDAARAMDGNWRWLNTAAGRILRDEDLSHDPALAERALAWTERALQVHDSRCPEPATCDARWYAERTHGVALLRVGKFALALDELTAVEKAASARQIGGLKRESESVAYIAMCLARMGRATESRVALARALSGIEESELGRRSNQNYARWLVHEARTIVGQ